MQLEKRYLVLKYSDLPLTTAEWGVLENIEAVAARERERYGKPPLDTVVVEADWPEYQGVVKSIMARS